jgi:hypothetical protein
MTVLLCGFFILVILVFAMIALSSIIQYAYNKLYKRLFYVYIILLIMIFIGSCVFLTHVYINI